MAMVFGMFVIWIVINVIQGGPEKTKAENFGDKGPQPNVGFFSGPFAKMGWAEFGVFHCSPEKNHDHKIGEYTAVSLVDLFAWVFFLG